MIVINKKFHSSEYFVQVIVIFFSSWLLSGLIFHKFSKPTGEEKFWDSVSQNFKGYLFMASLLFGFIVITEFGQNNWKWLAMSLLTYVVVSLSVFTVSQLSKRPRRTDEVSPSLLSAKEIVEEEIPAEAYFVNEPAEKYRLKNRSSDDFQLSEKLKHLYLKSFPNLYDLIDDSSELGSFDISRSVILRSRDPYNIEILPDGYLEFLLNLHEINDIRRLNLYFIEINKKLINGGVFVGCLQPIKFRYRRFLKRFPGVFGRIFYGFDFLFKRVLPKLPVVKKIYFAITGGKNRAISMAEGLGRLYYCGFEIIGSKDIDDFVYFVAKKVREPLNDANPSYGPLFKMRRIGKDGKLIFVYKMRTMHPYSEYLQKYVYERNKLDAGGKIKDDFRISTWGKVFRKLWIDELPMILNMLKGELKLVGVRPLSQHYLSLYSEELRQRRMKHKPGLVPPFYVDLPKTLDEIMASEMKYLEKYEKAPILTDIEYFFKSFYNIIIKRARSK